MKKIALIFGLCLFLSDVSIGQSFFNARENRRFIVSGGAGTSSYYGDLNNPSDYFDATLNINGGLTFAVGPQFLVRAEYTYFRLAGTDLETDLTEYRNLSFKSNNHEIGFTGIYHFLPSGTRFYQRPPVSPYVMVGAGMLFYRPKAELGGATYPLRRYQTEGRYYSPVALVIPVGAGLRFMVNPSFNVVVEASVRKTFTDYLDDVSNRYIDNSSFEDPIGAALADRGLNEIKPAGAVRGNPERKDAYGLFSVKVEYYLPSDVLNIRDFKKRPPGVGKKPRRRR